METKTVPTHEHIVERIRERQDADLFGFEIRDYLYYLPFEFASEFVTLKEGCTPEERDAEIGTLTRENVVKEMREYMAFAIGKAEDERGLSTMRSIQHYTAWTWLAGDVELSQIIDSGQIAYAPYGMPILRHICKFYGFEPELIKQEVS